MPDFRGKVALVTGASSPTGQAICRQLHGDHCTLIMTYYRNETAATHLNSTYCEKSGGFVIQMDVSDPTSVARVFAKVMDRFGKLDFLVNIASFSRRHLWNIDPTKISLDDWNLALHVDLTGSFLCAQASIPLMTRAGRGRIINFGSSGSMRGDANTFAYNAAKVGLVGLTKSLARAYAPAIVANLIAPGSVDSGWTERWGLTEFEKTQVHAVREMSRRPGTLSELSELVRFLLSEKAAYINGQVLYFDGGLST